MSATKPIIDIDTGLEIEKDSAIPINIHLRRVDVDHQYCRKAFTIKISYYHSPCLS